MTKKLLTNLTVDAPDLTNDNTPTITGETDAPDGTVITLVVTDNNGGTQTFTTIPLMEGYIQ